MHTGADQGVAKSAPRSEKLVEHLLSLPASLLDGPLGGNARMALLDTLGCGIYGAIQPWGKILREQIEHEGSRGKATLFGSQMTVAPSRAALANGTATHGFELDRSEEHTSELQSH